MSDATEVQAIEIDESQTQLDARLPQAHACAQCGAPVEDLDRFCNNCGAPQEQPEAAAPAAAPRSFRCQNCGSQVRTDAAQRSYVCPFCDSTYVVELDEAAVGRQPPEFVIGFAVALEKAQQSFRGWLRESRWFRPADLARAEVVEKLRGVYLPFWSFAMLAQSRWSATIGEYWYRTETYTTTENGKTVTKTRQVRETEWWPLAGKHHRYYSGYLVSASTGLEQSDAQRIQPFHLPGMKRYQPYFLAGWLCEEYTLERDAALDRCQQEFYRRERDNVAAFLPGDTHRSLDVQTWFDQVSSDLILLPIYLATYKHRDKRYRFLINGQTGQVAGEKPLSWARIALAVALGAAGVALAIAAGYLLIGQ